MSIEIINKGVISIKPTKDIYTELDKAYTYFNRALFVNRLPSCIITMQRIKGAYGYFCGDTWNETNGDNITDEISLNPDSFASRSLEKVLSTLVHEMCHLEQHHNGKPSNGGYHNKEWGRMMESCGLIPSHTGEEGGRKTGRQMTHYIEQGGVFEKACNKLVNKGFSISWQARTKDKDKDEATAAKKRATKTKYTCTTCDVKAWGKEGLNIKCGNCDKVLKSAT